MSTDKTGTGPTSMTTGGAVGRELTNEYWATMAGAADLGRKLTALADRYDAAMRDRDDPSADSRQRVALLRATAESCRRLVLSLARPSVPLRQQSAPSALERADRAHSRDVQASERDAAAQARDERATDRDVRVRGVTGDEDLDWAGRFHAACDRDLAAGDRADALADRWAAQVEREQFALADGVGTDSPASMYALVARLEDRAIVWQAQGVLMARGDLSAEEAFEALLLAACGPLTLDGVAEHVVRRGQLPSMDDAT